MRFLRYVIAVVTPFVLATTLVAQNLDVELQRAVQREMATGNHQAAIREYRRIADRAGSNRIVAAQALLRLAEAHQSVGDAEASKVYEQIVASFGDQEEVAALARTRLGNGPRAARSAAPLRRVWEIGARSGGWSRVARVSPNGQFFLLVT